MRRIMDRKGDAVMVTAVLMLSIVLSVGGRLLLDYGEVVGKDEDMVHAADVSDSMLSARGSMGELLKAQDTESRILNRITLGTFGNPYLGVARSSGELDYSPVPESFQLEVYLEEGGSELLLNSASGSLEFRSNNYYYHDQRFLFQGGGVILEEYGNYAMSTPPSNDIMTSPTGWSLSFILFSLTDQQWSTSGIESVALDIGMVGFSEVARDITAGQVVSFRINCEGEEAWAAMFRSLLNQNDLIENSDYTITEPADWTSLSDHLEVDLIGMEGLLLQSGEMEVKL